MVNPEQVRFAETGSVWVRSLQYWSKEHDPPEIFQRKCLALSERVDATFRRNNAAYEQGYDVPLARRALSTAFADGGTRMVDLGELCDTIYITPEETDVDNS